MKKSLEGVAPAVREQFLSELSGRGRESERAGVFVEDENGDVLFVPASAVAARELEG